MSVTEAQCALFRKYLRAYGPATLHDFAHWSGISMQEVRGLRPAMWIRSIVEVLRRQAAIAPAARRCSESWRKAGELSGKVCTRLLPIFDSYLLAHREKDHLLSMQHYKRVYRNQGWISPVVLVDGEIAGVWSYKPKGKKLAVEVEPFGKLSKVTRAGIEREADSLAVFFERELELKIAIPGHPSL